MSENYTLISSPKVNLWFCHTSKHWMASNIVETCLGPHAHIDMYNGRYWYIQNAEGDIFALYTVSTSNCTGKVSLLVIKSVFDEISAMNEQIIHRYNNFVKFITKTFDCCRKRLGIKRKSQRKFREEYVRLEEEHTLNRELDPFFDVD